MLDDLNILKQRDPQNALGIAAEEYKQLQHQFTLENNADFGGIEQIIVTGMGGSALAAGVAKIWLDLPVSFEVVRKYELPAYVNKKTLVITSSYSGNTEETLAALEDAEKKGAQIAVLASGGKLLQIAQQKNYPYVQLPAAMQPRMAVLYNLKALTLLLEHTKKIVGKVNELEALSGWLQNESQKWCADKLESDNLAKQLAKKIVGKTPIFYGGPKMSAIAYKWKIGMNENAKNVAFTNELPEFNHNEFIGWTSHPVEKPYAVVDLVSSFEDARVLKRFTVSDKLLSGMRPAATTVNAQGDSLLAQMVWGSVLGDFVSIYVAILNGVNPTPVDLIEKLKAELAQN